MQSPLIDIDSAEVWQGQTRVFKDLTLRIGRHENVAILGANGAGKSTLIKLLCRDLYPVRDGRSSVRILGQDRFNVQQYRHVLGLVSHDLQADYAAAACGRDIVLSGFSASVGLSGIKHTFSRQEQETAESLMVELQIRHLADKPFHAMSTGEQRRFLMARALAPQPAYLILDEPTAGLDLKASFALLKAMTRYIEQGRSLVLATHHLHEIPARISRVILLQRGEVFADGDVDRLLSESVLSNFYDTPVRLVHAHGIRFAIPGQETAG